MPTTKGQLAEALQPIARNKNTAKHVRGVLGFNPNTPLRWKTDRSLAARSFITAPTLP